MNLTDLPMVNAILNGLAGLFLVLGRIRIKKGDRSSHQTYMITALVVSVLFLISYSVYHAQVGSVPYPHQDWTRLVYFIILVPHIILAAIMGPFIIALVWLAVRAKFETHRRLARLVWPVWMFVSVSGVLIYLMLYGRG
jgi:uncharacterized membrane protein YozB (DUF420 family)